MLLAILLTGSAVAIALALLFNLCVYALPLCIGIAAASFAHRTGAGLVGAAVVGLAAGVLAHAVGKSRSAALATPRRALWSPGSTPYRRR